MAKKQIAVFGATGAQGGSVVQAILDDGEFEPVALVRNPASDKAKALAAKGVKVVTADQSDTAAVEKALEGVDSLFVVTFFWDPKSMGKEYEVASGVAAAAKKAGVKHVVYSTLPNTDVIGEGKWHVPHFADKAKADAEFANKGFDSVAYFVATFYYNNYAAFGLAKKADDGGEYTFYSTAVKGTDAHTAFDVADTGSVVIKMFKEPVKYNGKYVAAVGEDSPMQSYVDAFNAARGANATLHVSTVEQASAAGYPGAEEMAQMYGYFEDCGYLGNKKSGHYLKPEIVKTKSWAAYVKDNADFLA